MSDFTYPGVYIQEKPGAPSPLSGVSASTLALVGFTEKGPINDPVLVTGFKDFERRFGGFISESIIPTTLHAFFKNGGALARIVRVVGAGAASAVAYISEPVTAEVIGTGDTSETNFTGTLATSPVEPGTFTAADAVETFSDNGDGTLTGDDGGSGTIDYDTGEFDVTFHAAPAAASITAGYSTVLWKVQMSWPGAAGNSYRLNLYGAPGFEVDATATFTRWSLDILEQNEEGNYVVVEQYAEMDFTDPTAADFFPLVVNDDNGGSLNVTVIDVGNTGVPSSLAGTAVTAETLGTGDGTTTNFTGTLASASCAETTLTITTVDTGDGALTVTDDGEGNLVGDVAATGNNTIDYDTGAFDVTFSAAVKSLSDVDADYYSQPDVSVSGDFAGGLDGSAVSTSETISASLEADNEGLYALNKTDDLLLVGVPDFAGDEITDGALVDYCEARMDRFAILATPEGLNMNQAINYKKRTLNKNNSSYAALYHPWVTVLDPVTEKAVNIPPIGHVAGVYARTDSTKNVGKAPAGAVDGALRFCIGLEAEYTRAQVGQLNTSRVNAIVNWPAVGTYAVWGARTLQVNGEFGYIQARRLFQFLEKSIYNSTHIYVFETNGSALWTRIRLQLTGFLFRLFTLGYFAGNSPEEAFFVVVDATNNPQSSVDSGILSVDIGVAPNKPAEFLVFSFQTKIPG